jgi:L-iditol 2-dehydrogenase
MRVAMYYGNNDIRIEEQPIPQINDNEVLIKIYASGICGSDVMEWYRIDKVPLVLGHEIGGRIEKVGTKIKKYHVGDRVSASHHVPCNTCYYCLHGHHTICDTLRSTNFDPGGFSEYVRLPPINVDRGIYPLPDSVSLEQATFIEPLACVLRAQQKAGLTVGQSVLVIGSGIAGLLHIQLARILGATHVMATDIDEFRLKMAKKFGADEVWHAREDIPHKIREANNGRGADLIIVCTGAVPAIMQALHSVERGGTILFFAPTDKGVTIPLSVNDVFWRNDVTFTTSYAGSPADHMTALDIINSGAVNVTDMITHRFGLENIEKGFHLVAQGKKSIKVIIEPQKKA